jgi:hypothetical protein
VSSGLIIFAQDSSFLLMTHHFCSGLPIFAQDSPFLLRTHHFCSGLIIFAQDLSFLFRTQHFCSGLIIFPQNSPFSLRTHHFCSGLAIFAQNSPFFNKKITKNTLVELVTFSLGLVKILSYKDLFHQPYNPLDWVAQTFLNFKCQLKLNWHVHRINLHLRFNWGLNLIDVYATQSRILHRLQYKLIWFKY